MAAPLSILHVDTERGFSGGEAQVVGLVEGLRARGHRCLVAGPRDGELAARGRGLGWEWRDLAVGGDADLGAVLRLARLLREEAPDLVHLHTGRAAWIGGWAARRAGVPAVVTRRQDKALRGWKHRTTYARLAAHAVGISPAVTAQLRAAGASAERTSTIWSAVDPTRLAPTAPRAELRRRFELPADAFVVATLAALVRRKGLDVLVDALGGLATRREVVALVAGDGPERATLEAAATSLPARRSLRLVGRVDHAGDALAAADAACLPSRAEGLGVAALEALAVGLPVVATRVGGLGEAVADAGLVVPPEDPTALADALDRLADDAGLRATLAAAGRARVAAEFLFETQVARYEALYARIVERRLAPLET